MLEVFTHPFDWNAALNAVVMVGCIGVLVVFVVQTVRAARADPDKFREEIAEAVEESKTRITGDW